MNRNIKNKTMNEGHSELSHKADVIGSAFKSFIDVYQLPFHQRNIVDTWVYDEGNNFCFQFEEYKTKVPNKFLLEVINGERNLEDYKLIFTHKQGEIFDNDGCHWITIRGWGNLTSPNCFGFSPEEAANIQDTLAEYIIERLNFRAKS